MSFFTPIFRSKIHTQFQIWLWAEIMLWSLGSKRKQKNSLNAFRICIFLFCSYSFGIKTINTFISSQSSLENPTLLQTKMGKVYTRFQTKKAQNWPHTLWGGTYLPVYGLYEGAPPRDFAPIFMQIERLLGHLAMTKARSLWLSNARAAVKANYQQKSLNSGWYALSKKNLRSKRANTWINQ